MEQELKELEVHLKNGDRDGARMVLKKLIARPLTPEEEGGGFVGIAAAYLKVMNKIQADYLAALDEAAEGLEMLDTEETARMDILRKGEVKGRLKKSA